MPNIFAKKIILYTSLPSQRQWVLWRPAGGAARAAAAAAPCATLRRSRSHCQHPRRAGAAGAENRCCILLLKSWDNKKYFIVLSERPTRVKNLSYWHSLADKQTRVAVVGDRLKMIMMKVSGKRSKRRPSSRWRKMMIWLKATRSPRMKIAFNESN